MYVLSMFFSFEEFLISPISTPSIFNWISWDTLRTHHMKFAAEWTPESMMINYEKACINIYHSVFPDAQLSDCYFHLKQNLHPEL